jgi:prepilin-type processing-associated H-X9-DG protein
MAGDIEMVHQRERLTPRSRVLAGFQYARGISNLICFVERDASQFMSPNPNDPRQDDYDTWLGTNIFQPWIAATRHSGLANYLYLDGHVESLQFANCVQDMYPDGVVLTQDGTFAN